MDWIFVGDAHFAFGDDERRERFIQFIKNNKASMTNLVIMGDLFDFWFGFSDLSSLMQEYGSLIHLFQDVRNHGVKVMYLEGNHDFQIGSYIRDELGVEVHPCSAEIELNGSRVYLAHGDRATPGLTNKISSFLLKNGLTYKVISWLGPKFVINMAKKMSANSRRRGRQHASEVALSVRNFAVKKIAEGYDTVIMAHTHIPEAMTVERGEAIGSYYNVGNWTKDFSYVRYNPTGGFSLEYFGVEVTKGA